MPPRVQGPPGTILWPRPQWLWQWVAARSRARQLATAHAGHFPVGGQPWAAGLPLKSGAWVRRQGGSLAEFAVPDCRSFWGAGFLWFAVGALMPPRVQGPPGTILWPQPQRLWQWVAARSRARQLATAHAGHFPVGGQPWAAGLPLNKIGRPSCRDSA